MSYYELKILSEGRDVEAISTYLEEELQALSITWQDAGDEAIFEPELETTPLWREVHIKAIYDDAQTAHLAQTELEKKFNGTVVEVYPLVENDWETAWHKYFKPIQITPHFWIVPTGLEPPQYENTQWIYLSPGLAFGTGNHPTTHLCLQWLAEQDLKDKIIIDYGCGSGILALAALKLGAKHVHCIDIDKQALIATKNNLELNDFSGEQISTYLPHQVPSDLRAEVLVANILLSPLMELRDHFYTLLPSSSPIALSGIMSDQFDELNASYQEAFQPIKRHNKDNWSLWSGVKA